MGAWGSSRAARGKRRAGSVRCSSRSRRYACRGKSAASSGSSRTSSPRLTASRELAGQHLFAGYYANELLLRLTARDDANAPVFSCYSRCLAELAGGAHVARTMRIFEMRLLEALGYGLELDADAGTGEPLRAERRYAFVAEHGLRAADAADADADVFSGRALIALREQTLDDDDTLREAQRLLGRVLRVYLGERPLKSRLVMQDIVRRGL